MSDSMRIFELFEELGQNKLLPRLKNIYVKNKSKISSATNAPDDISINLTKESKTWSLKEAANLVAIAPQTIRLHWQKGLLPPPIKNKGQRVYRFSLEDINKLRKHFKTNLVRETNQTAAIVAFTNFKGGVAKTTASKHFANYLVIMGYKVLFIDTDSQASATRAFGYAPDTNISAKDTLLPFFLKERDDIKNIILPTNWKNLHLIPANLQLYGVELQLPILQEISKSTVNIHSLLDSTLTPIKKDYDFIIIDCPPSMSILNTNALYAATDLIIPCPPELPDVSSMVQFFSLLKGTLALFPEKQYDLIRILITKHDKNNTAIEVTKELERAYDEYVLNNYMYRTEAVKQAWSSMNSIYEVTAYKSKETLNRAIRWMNAVNREMEELICSSHNINKSQSNIDIEVT